MSHLLKMIIPWYMWCQTPCCTYSTPNTSSAVCAFPWSCLIFIHFRKEIGSADFVQRIKSFLPHIILPYSNREGIRIPFNPYAPWPVCAMTLPSWAILMLDEKMTLVHFFGHISLNNGPIWKIKKLADSLECPLSRSFFCALGA